MGDDGVERSVEAEGPPGPGTRRRLPERVGRGERAAAVAHRARPPTAHLVVAVRVRVTGDRGF
ncbi:MAG TPA: hypothetical protein VMW47_09465 [Verrucomicrobiae bacterium]|nr:hypothetical protein [Verrucomicrobiae bacterium]